MIVEDLLILLQKASISEECRYTLSIQTDRVRVCSVCSCGVVARDGQELGPLDKRANVPPLDAVRQHACVPEWGITNELEGWHSKCPFEQTREAEEQGSNWNAAAGERKDRHLLSVSPCHSHFDQATRQQASNLTLDLESLIEKLSSVSLSFPCRRGLLLLCAASFFLVLTFSKPEGHLQICEFQG